MAGLQGRKCWAQNAIPQYTPGFRASSLAPSSAPEELVRLEYRDTLPTAVPGPARAGCRASRPPFGTSASAHVKIVSRKIFRGSRADWDPWPGRWRTPECAPQLGASVWHPSADAGQQETDSAPVERSSPRGPTHPSPTSDGPRPLSAGPRPVSPAPIQDVQPTHAEQRGTPPAQPAPAAGTRLKQPGAADQQVSRAVERERPLR